MQAVVELCFGFFFLS